MMRPFGDGEMALRIREFDWAATSLGALADWPGELLSTVETMLAMPGPAVLLWGDALSLIYNDAYIAIARDRHPALLGLPALQGWSDILSDALRQRLAAVRGGASLSLHGLEVAVRDADGRFEPRIFDIAWSPVRDPTGVVAGALQTLVEVTEHARAAARLRESEARLRALIETGSHMLYRMSADWGRLMLLNGRTMLADIDEPVDDWLVRFVPPEDREAVRAAVAAARAGPHVFDCEHRVWRADGTVGWVLSRAVPILAADDTVIEWFGSGIDVTARRTADEAVRRSEELRRIALDGGGMAAWRYDIATRELRGDARYFALLGLPPSDDPVPHAHFVAQLTPHWQKAALRFIERTFVAGEEFDGEMEFAGGPGAGRWLRWRGRVDAPNGSVIHGVVFDVTEQRLAQASVLARDQLLRQFGDASQNALWVREAATLRWRYLTPAFRIIHGLARREALSGDHYRRWLDLVLPEDRDTVERAVARLRGGEHATVDYRIRRVSDGETRWLRTTEFPIRDADGQVALIGGITEDITSSRVAREALERSEERLRSAVEVGGVGLWDWNVLTDEVHWSDQHFLLQGLRVDAVTPSYAAWRERIHPDDRARTDAMIEAALVDRTPYAQEFRVVHPDGSRHWHAARGRFFYDDAGQPVRMTGAMIDVTTRREWQERQQVLIAELQHRTRNLLGVIQSLVEQGVRAASDLPDLRRRLGDRLQALARAQGLLSQLNDCERVTFDALLDAELAALGSTAAHVTRSGPRGVRLRSSTVQTLAMALHELATNAVKYGALGQCGAQLSIDWRLERDDDSEPWLHIDWRESGVAMPAAGTTPAGSGQGRELIEHALPYQLGARTSYAIGGDGVRCHIAIPVSVSL